MPKNWRKSNLRDDPKGSQAWIKASVVTEEINGMGVRGPTQPRIVKSLNFHCHRRDKEEL